MTASELLSVVDVAAAVSALVANSGAVSEMWAAVIGMLVAIVLWWGVAYLLLRVRASGPHQTGRDFDIG